MTDIKERTTSKLFFSMKAILRMKETPSLRFLVLQIHAIVFIIGIRISRFRQCHDTEYPVNGHGLHG